MNAQSHEDTDQQMLEKKEKLSNKLLYFIGQIKLKKITMIMTKRLRQKLN